MSLIYLIASLPTLQMYAASSIQPSKFCELCSEQLNHKDATTAQALLHGIANNHPFALAWSEKEIILRNAIAQQRAKRLNQPYSHYLHAATSCDLRIEALVEDAFEDANPLKREQALDEIRWLLSEELQGPDPLNINVVFAYAIKLALQTRWLTLNSMHGHEMVEKLTKIV